MTARNLAIALFAALLLPLGAQARAEKAVTTAPDPARLTKPVFVVEGRGWGHGIGLSQWGTYGFARAGHDYRRILAHYYRGTQLGPAPVSRVRVLLADKVTSVAVASDETFSVKDVHGTTWELAAGRHLVAPTLRLKVDGDAKARTLDGPLTVIGGAAPVEVNGRPYRGTIQLSLASGKLRAVNTVGLEQYLYGVVPSEVPHVWPAEALKAQAVVARSYALSHLHRGPFDLYADTRSQVYLGIDEEEPQTNAAVNATAGQVLLYGGRVASTYYHSTSGGRTASVEEVWSSEPIPYLVSVPDPFDGASPHHDWGPQTIPAAKLARTLRVAGKLVDVRTTVGPSGRVVSAVGVTPDGEGPPVSGSDLRRALELRSTWFTVGQLALEKPAAALPFGGVHPLRGVARGVGPVTIEQRVPGEPWTVLRTVKPSAAGTFAIRVKPKSLTLYRVLAGDVKTGVVRLNVAPRVTMAPARGATQLRGAVRPALAGAVVQVQRRRAAGWKVVASVPVAANGRWQAAIALAPGSYRARVPARGGLGAGVSTVLTVEPA